MKNKTPFIFAVLFVGVLALVSSNGCSVFESDDPEVTIKGETGRSCTYDWECKSNACVYPGICQ